MFETRSQSWRDAGLLRQISPRAVRRARIEALLLIPLFVGIVIAYDNLKGTLENDLKPELRTLVEIAVVVLLMIVGWVAARSVGRALAPALFRRLEPATAGPVGFLLRLLTVVATFVVALSVAGVGGRTIALGGAFTAVIVGLAAQQTLGNVIAGTMLLSTRPFRVGDRVRLQGGVLGGPVDGVVSSLGLFYTTFVCETDTVMIPNGVVMAVLVVIGDAHPSEEYAYEGGGAAMPVPSAPQSQPPPPPAPPAPQSPPSPAAPQQQPEQQPDEVGR